MWSSEDITGCNYVSLKLARVFSELKGCPDIMHAVFWEFGMTDFLLKEKQSAEIILLRVNSYNEL